jgi:hypothetical protein
MAQLSINPAALFDEAVATVAGYELLALMTFPNNTKARDECVMTMKVKMVSDMSLKSKDIPSEMNYPNEREIILRGLSYPQVRGELNDSTRHEAWQSVISITSLLMRMQQYTPDAHGGVSISKSIALMNLPSSPYLRKHGHQNSKYMRTAWNDYKSVAHLLFSYSLIQNQPFYTKDFLFTVAGIKMWLGLARLVQAKLLAIKTQHHQNTNPVTEQELWRVPSGWGLTSLEFDMPVFNQRELEEISSRTTKKSA